MGRASFAARMSYVPRSLPEDEDEMDETMSRFGEEEEEGSQQRADQSPGRRRKKLILPEARNLSAGLFNIFPELQTMELAEPVISVGRKGPQVHPDHKHAFHQKEGRPELLAEEQFVRVAVKPEKYPAPVPQDANSFGKVKPPCCPHH